MYDISVIVREKHLPCLYFKLYHSFVTYFKFVKIFEPYYYLFLYIFYFYFCEKGIKNEMTKDNTLIDLIFNIDNQLLYVIYFKFHR